MRKLYFCLCEKMTHISCAVTAQLICVFVFATQIVQSSSTYIQNFKHLAFLCDCTSRFVSDLVGNPLDLFSRVAAHMSQIERNRLPSFQPGTNGGG